MRTPLSDNEHVGENLIRLRKAKGLSQSALAETMQAAGHDWHQNTVSRIENGRQSLDLKEIEHLEELLGGGLLEGTEVGQSFQEWATSAMERAIQAKLEQAEQSLQDAIEAVNGARQLLAARGPKGYAWNARIPENTILVDPSNRRDVTNHEGVDA